MILKFFINPQIDHSIPYFPFKTLNLWIYSNIFKINLPLQNGPPSCGFYSFINDHPFSNSILLVTGKISFHTKMSSWGKKFFEGGKNRVIFKSSKREKKRNLSYTGIRIYQLGFRRVILFTSFLPPTLPEKFFTPLIV